MLPRFLGEIDADAGSARLDADEARHLSQVLRLGAGDEVAVFDGAGREFRARVERVSRDRADLALVEASVAAPESAVRLTLAQAALKGDKMDEVIRDATMMGVAAIEPLVTAHTAAHLKPGSAPERWRRVAVASSKQCRRAVVPSIGSGLTFNDWIARDVAEVKLILVEPSAVDPSAAAAETAGRDMHAAESAGRVAQAGARPVVPVLEKRRQTPSSATLLVGPEGGWSAEEIERALGAGYRPLTLGRRTLRADVVPVIAIGVLQYLWGDL